MCHQDPQSNPPLKDPRLRRLETKASEVRAGKPRGPSGKLSLRGLVGGPPAEGKDLEWTAVVHLRPETVPGAEAHNQGACDCKGKRTIQPAG